MKNYIGIVFSILWTLGYFLYFDGVLSELVMMILWFVILIFIALPWGVLSIMGLIDENKRNIKLLFDNKLGKYFIFLLGLILFMWGIAISLYILYKVVTVVNIDFKSVFIVMFISFLFIRMGYNIIIKGYK